MCGVFGFVSTDNRGPDLKTLEKIAAVTMIRGPHAFGFSWIDSRGVIKMYKQAGRIVDNLGLLSMARDARMLIGHCRWATHGDPENNLNNHPHPVDGGWFVHNGVLHNYEAMIAEHDLYPVSSCDSELIACMADKEEGTAPERLVAATRYVDSPLVVLGLWSRPARLVVVKSGNPLSLGFTRDGAHSYFGSLRDDLPGDVRTLKNNSAWLFTETGLKRMKERSAS